MAFEEFPFHKFSSKIIKLGVIGDIHAQSNRLKIALEFIQNLKLQPVLCVGDIVDGPGDVNDCCDLLKKYQVITVKGNHDEWFLSNSMRDLPDATRLVDVNQDSQQFIRNLPLEQMICTAAGNLLLCHGLGKKTMAKVRDDDEGYALEMNFELQDLIKSNRYRFVINGHTHYKMVRDFGTMILINAGSLLYEDAGFLIIDFESRLLRFYGFGTSSPTILKEEPF